MIVRDKPGPMQLLFAMRGSILPRILAPLAGLTLFAALMVWLDQTYAFLPHSDPAPFAIFAAALSLFLGFRNNAAYDRWWEARKLWGGLLADLRSLAREIDVFAPKLPSRLRLLRLGLAFAHLHRAQLRQLPQDEKAAQSCLAADLPPSRTPCAALDAMAKDIAQGHAAGLIDGFGARSLTQRIGALALQQAGCERIAATPLPYVYSLLIFRTIYLYCLLLPLALAGPAGWMTPVFVAIVAYVFLGLAEVSEELAHPFGATVNGLPLDAICRNMEISLAPHLGETAPPPFLPQDFQLS